MTILGYRKLDDTLIAQVNRNKIQEEALLRMLEAFEQRYDMDPRWMAIAKTHFETGFMALNRALMRPERLGDAEFKSALMDAFTRPIPG